MSGVPHFDVVIIGGGPSGQKAAIQAAKAKKSVLVIERDRIGGECVQRGTIPSKTLRESAVYLRGLRERTLGLVPQLQPGTTVAQLMQRLRTVLESHQDYLGNQLDRNMVDLWRGRARFLDPHRLEVDRMRGTTEVTGEVILIATGSSPRNPDHIDIDHEHVLDSDSILSLIYLPKSLTVIGAGVIACEFATVMAALEVDVTMVDRCERPLGFMEEELSIRFQASFEAMGGRFMGGETVTSSGFDGISATITELESGDRIVAEKVFCAQGRVARINGLDLESIGVELTPRGHVKVDDHCQTSVPHIYAAGDVIGPPALATTAIEQGRRAMRHALGFDLDALSDLVPVGIYTIPELSCIGMTEAQAVEEFGAAWVGQAEFREIARGHINGNTEGVLKLVCEPRTGRIVGAHILGEGATELVHIAQMAMIGGFDVNVFIENIFNFPTLAEAYRVAALDVLGQHPEAAKRAA